MVLWLLVTAHQTSIKTLLKVSVHSMLILMMHEHMEAHQLLSHYLIQSFPKMKNEHPVCTQTETDCVESNLECSFSSITIVVKTDKY